MIVVTGAAGFIGSHMAGLAALKSKDLILVDHLPLFEKHAYNPELLSKRETRIVDTLELPQILKELKNVQGVIHMGAITNTAEMDVAKLDQYNTNYTQNLWRYCTERNIPFIYASSAATYGDGSQGFSDDHNQIFKLKPLNPYGLSKHKFDLFALDQSKTPNGWWGLKFFNVYGPHEDHKERMASTVWHGFYEIVKTSKMTLFKSHNPEFKDGEQRRDFVYIDDVIAMVNFIMEKQPKSGIYNIGTGTAKTYLELAHALFSALEKPTQIHWIDTPIQFRDGYQYHTQAEMTKLFSQGYEVPVTPLNTAIGTYVRQYLNKKIQ